MLLLDSQFSAFLGHFHPLVVHLPIGLLLLAGIMEYFSQKPQYAKLDGAISFTLLLGAGSALISALFGWFLANEGAYASSTLFWHRWLGIGVAVLSTLVWAIKSERLKASNTVYKSSLGGIVLLLVITGHLGGNLTHGAGYLLDSAPGFIQKIFGHAASTKEVADFSKANPDSLNVYAELIQPVFEKKCYSCHNDNKANGGLNMSSEEALLEGGDHAEVFVAGNPRESHLVKRVTLDQSSKKFMPPKGIPLNYTEVRLLEWWISQGASFSNTLSETETNEDIKTLLMEHYQLSTRKKSFVEIATAEPANENILNSLSQNGFRVTPIAQNSNLLEVSAQDSLTKGQIEALLEVKEQLTWLSIGNCGITDDMLPIIGQLNKLSTLKLEKNPITSEGVKSLTNLDNLESLNLFATQVDDQAAQSIQQMKALQAVYLWQSKFSVEAAQQLQTDKPSLEVNIGLSYAQKEEEETE